MPHAGPGPTAHADHAQRLCTYILCERTLLSIVYILATVPLFVCVCTRGCVQVCVRVCVCVCMCLLSVCIKNKAVMTNL